ncbi:DUF4346 domain-containing protein [Methanolapillus ohkumae]|uniref:Pterin-binding domain-containing protein n=1 Tax=Methanolapillus ohkumae TaxID=3028298 RepID=A0AA96VI02_9EURY|nr:hypothetical protein MsAm2_06330 [Methanosarcinaceae archaeon Am2]
MAFAKRLGLSKLIADPVLSPPGHRFLESLFSYFEFHRLHPFVPILFGAGNVTELLDADSPGQNALLSVLADECGASILFTPDASSKTKGSVSELKTAAQMNALAKIRASAPKDLGLDLLILKEKRRRPNMDLKNLSGRVAPLFSDQSDLIFAGDLSPDFVPETTWGWKPDKAGNFLIGVISVFDLESIFSLEKNGVQMQDMFLKVFENVKTLNRDVIVAIHPKKIIIGTDSAFMLEKIIQENLITELSHAGYLGRELEKAEIAIRLGRSYAQDDLF